MQGSSSGCDYSNGDAASSATTTNAELCVGGGGGGGGGLRSTSVSVRHQLNSSTKRSANDAGLTMTSSTGLTSDEDDDDDDVDSSPPPVGKLKVPPANGKKTKGRVKIKMEFIDNKLRRYTTFSKRKTGIMKKAYELSTLTGTQVMLLVASETGHVYTFATRKLQPMITSEAGKALIQTCLNSPDPLLNCGSSNNDDGGGGGGGGGGMCGGGVGVVGGNDNGAGNGAGNGGMSSDQRMSATGFEETEFTYSINDDDQKVDLGKSQGPFSGVGSSHLDSGSSQSPTLTDLSATATCKTSASTLFNPASKPNPLTVKTVQIPSAPTFTTVSTSGQTSASQQQQSTAVNTSAQNNVMMVPTSQQGLSMIKGSLVNVTSVAAATTTSSVQGAVMYQTPQGFLYATPTTASLPEGVLFNFGQLQQQAGAGSSAQQYITIPLSLTPASQIVHGVNLDGHSAAKNVTDLSKGGAKK